MLHLPKSWQDLESCPESRERVLTACVTEEKVQLQQRAMQDRQQGLQPVSLFVREGWRDGGWEGGREGGSETKGRYRLNW